MKKLLAVVLAAMMALSLGVMASADNSAKPVATYQWYDADGNEVASSDPNFPAAWTPLSGTINAIGFDSEKASTDLINPDSKVWVNLALKGHDFDFQNKDLWKIKTDKGDDNAKLISSIGVATADKDKFGDGTGRRDALKIVLKPDYTDNDYKFSPSVKLTYKGDKDNDPLEGYYVVVDVKFYMGNFGEDADQDYDAGKGGVVLKPQTNEDNEITWEDENNTIATLKFVGDDDGKYFFPKLSTMWNDADYAEYFADQDAFIFNFKGSAAGKTKIASTSRATLELYNPYYDEDEDELTVDPENVVIYSVEEDGSLLDVTASFKAVETDDGEYVFQTKTRELGVYVIAEKAYTTAVEDVETPDDGKAIPDTGIWA